MSVYLRKHDGERFLLDTAKCKLVFEGVEHDLTGAKLEFYDADMRVLVGTIGTEEFPARIWQVEDPFTGLIVETPMRQSAADALAERLIDEA